MLEPPAHTCHAAASRAVRRDTSRSQAMYLPVPPSRKSEGLGYEQPMERGLNETIDKQVETT